MYICFHDWQCISPLPECICPLLLSEPNLVTLETNETENFHLEA